MLASAVTLFSLESDGEEARRCCYLIFIPRKPRTANCVHACTLRWWWWHQSLYKYWYCTEGTLVNLDSPLPYVWKKKITNNKSWRIFCWAEGIGWQFFPRNPSSLLTLFYLEIISAELTIPASSLFFLPQTPFSLLSPSP